MRAEEIVSLLRGRGHYPTWRAKCPVHKSRGLTLAIKAGNDRTHITCHAGCHSDDVLATIGLKWTDTLYQQKTDPKAWAAEKRKREVQEKRASDLRIGKWILRIIGKGYTRDDARQDNAILCACAIVLTSSPSRNLQDIWERILKTATERIAAAEHVMERKMMPEFAAPRDSDWPTMDSPSIPTRRTP